MNSTKAIAKLQSLQTHPTKVTLVVKDPSTGDKMPVRGWAIELIPTAASQPPNFTFTIKL